METMPRKFFGAELKNISSIEDAAKAIKAFCQLATADEVKGARRELRVLATVNTVVYDAINRIIWNIEFPLGTQAWRNRFSLLNAAL